MATNRGTQFRAQTNTSVNTTASTANTNRGIFARQQQTAATNNVRTQSSTMATTSTARSYQSSSGSYNSKSIPARAQATSSSYSQQSVNNSNTARAPTTSSYNTQAKTPSSSGSSTQGNNSNRGGGGQASGGNGGGSGNSVEGLGLKTTMFLFLQREEFLEKLRSQCLSLIRVIIIDCNYTIEQTRAVTLHTGNKADIHFYYNNKTGEVVNDIDFKIKGGFGPKGNDVSIFVTTPSKT